MMAASLPEGEEMVELLLKKEADVNCKSDQPPFSIRANPSDILTTQNLDHSGQVNLSSLLPWSTIKPTNPSAGGFTDRSTLLRFEEHHGHSAPTSRAWRFGSCPGYPGPIAPASCGGHWVSAYGDVIARE